MGDGLRIAVLGWGSLIWNQGVLQISGEWKEDGPKLPIEFARVSRNGRLTLAITSGSESVQVLWNIMGMSEIEQAIRNLQNREEMPTKEGIGWTNLKENKTVSRNTEEGGKVGEWANRKGLDAVIWTDLEPNFESHTGMALEGENVVKYLRSLPLEAQKKAEKYIRCAPRQMKTRMREYIADVLGWTPIDCR